MAAMAGVNRVMPPKQQPQARTPEISKVYDPVKTAEGMFNGCVSRIAVTLRDPKNYGQSTPYIIAESSKRFQDALDDLTLQVLDVKWLLEQKLEQNRAKREAERKVKESATAAANTPSKRKLNDVEESPNTPSKKSKTGEPSPNPSTNMPNGNLNPASTQPTQRSTPQPETITIDDPEPEKPASENTKQNKPEPAPAQQENFDIDDFARPSTHGTPAMTDDGIGIFDDSMFDTELNNDTSNMNEGDDGLNFEFSSAFIQEPTQPDISTNNLNNTTNASQSRPESQDVATNQPSSLLSGLEQYANMGNPSDDMNAGLGITQNAAANTNGNQFNSAFEPNIFDDLLADDSLGMGDGGGMVGFGDDVNIDMQENLDFDELFGKD